jgi:hypothetical protein
MAHFRGTVTGNRGTASRLGHKKTGLTVTCDGWNNGIEVEAYFNSGDKSAGVPEHDCFFIYKTGGSNSSQRNLVATISGNKIRLNDMSSMEAV